MNYNIKNQSNLIKKRKNKLTIKPHKNERNKLTIKPRVSSSNLSPAMVKI